MNYKKPIFFSNSSMKQYSCQVKDNWNFQSYSIWCLFCLFSMSRLCIINMSINLHHWISAQSVGNNRREFFFFLNEKIYVWEMNTMLWKGDKRKSLQENSTFPYVHFIFNFLFDIFIEEFSSFSSCLIYLLNFILFRKTFKNLAKLSQKE